MKVVFLDIDGVLVTLGKDGFANPNKVFEAFGRDLRPHEHMHPDAIEQLNILTAYEGVQVVLSSSWRTMYGVEDTETVMRVQGYKGPSFLGRTDSPFVIREAVPGDSSYGYSGKVYSRRGHEIQKWLDDWKGDPVENFVILDDDADMVHLMDKLVLCGSSRGLTERKRIKAERQLGIES